MTIKVRFAPSPTGNVHIGNIRTAIFNWLFARHSNGKFLVRVEDTDKERSTQEAINKLFECMKWLGLDYDDELYYQSRHEGEHQNAAEKLIREKKAYCRLEDNGEKGPVLFRIPFDLPNSSFVVEKGKSEQDIHPEVPLKIDYTGIRFAQISKKGKPVDYSACLAGFKNLEVFDVSGNKIYELNDDIETVIAGEKTVKLENCSKIIYTRREVVYDDLIKGHLSKPLDSIKDLVIVRSDGSPVFHLANVFDDAAQNITHIIRGDDHVENTYRHILLFHALGYEIPLYGHMPMIVNKQGKPYSKRDGDAFVGDFQEKGILPEAMFNYLSLLGWSPGDDREKMSENEIIEAFTLDRVKSSPAQFDMNKLLNMNGSYMAELEFDSFKTLALKEARNQGWGESISENLFFDVAKLMQGRTKLISQVKDWKYFFFNDSPLFQGVEEEQENISAKLYNYDSKAVKKILGKSENVSGLNAFLNELEKSVEFDSKKVETAIREAERQQGIQEGKLNQAVRVAVTGKNGGADLIDTLLLIGKDSVVVRIKKITGLFK